MIIRTNMSSVQGNRMLQRNTENLDRDFQRLSSGKRINRAADDAAGLAVSEKLTTQYKGLKQAARNAMDGVSFVQTTEGFLEENTVNLQRIRQLAIQAATGLYTPEDRGLIELEVQQRLDEVDRIGVQAQFNNQTLFDGTFEQIPFTVHVGANADQNISLNIGLLNTESLGINTLTLADVESSNAAIAMIDNALQQVVELRTNLGSFESRLDSIIRTNDLGHQNMLASTSRITDANMAEEMSNFMRDSILSQSTMAILAQANLRNQSVLSLLQ